MRSSTERRSFGWVNLDRGDSSPRNLWTSIALGLNDVIDRLDTSRLLHIAQSKNPDIVADFLPVVASALNEGTDPVVLILDGLDFVNDPDALWQLTSFLGGLPERLHLILISRSTPALPLSRLRLAGQLSEIRTAYLAFDTAETQKLVRQLSGIKLRPAELATLVHYTEGWPAMVHLAGLSLRESTDPSGFIATFSGTNRQVVDYLGEEVVSKLSGEVVEFLTRISILDRFSASLCDAVAGTDRSARLIAELEQANLFVVRLDDNRCWYRFHNVFRDFLSDLLERTEPGVRNALHKGASEWYAENGFVELAIEHALSGHDPDTAVNLIALHWHTLSVVDRAAALNGWLKRIGGELMEGNATAAICAARVAALNGDRNGMHHWLAVAAETGHEGPLPEGTLSVRSAEHLLRSEFGFDGLRDLLESAETAVGLEVVSHSPWFAQARFALGYGRLLSGAPDYAVPPLEEAAQSNSVTPGVRIVALAALSLAKDALGWTQQSQSLARAARAEVDSYGLRDAPEISLAYTAMGVAASRAGRDEEARQELDHALRIRWQVLGLSPWPTLTGLLAMARFELSANRLEAARRLVEQARELLRTLPGHQDHLWFELAEIEDQLNIGAGDPHPSADSLTDREIAVLRMLAGDLSLREIGGRLYVSVNTVKSHARAIYRKLGASSRNEAVERAGELGLLQVRALPPRG